MSGVTDLSFPSCLDSPRNTAVSVSPAAELQDGVPVTLTCSSDANPPVQTYTWYQGAACLPAADKNLHQARRSPATPSGRGSTLSSASITTEDSGQHCCVASNRRGSQTESVTLTGSKGGSMKSLSVTESEFNSFQWQPCVLHNPAEHSPRVTPGQTCLQG